MGWRRWLIVLCGMAITGQALALCSATGWRTFTRYPSAEIEQMNSNNGLETIFANTSLNDRLGPIGRVENTFAFGLLPFPTLGREALSVTTVGGPAAALVLIGLWPARARHDRRWASERKLSC